MSDVQSVSVVANNIKEYFKDEPLVKISDISGRMKQELIAEEIKKFSNFETNILISTTIIEVGVNVPNSTVMVIKSSERFGLAQAHQLRGRVGRGKFQSYCLLQTTKDDRKAEILCSTCDGFEIAKQDLLLRGTGDYIGTKQTGNNKDVMLMIAEPELYKRIAALNEKIYGDPSLFARYKYILDDYNEENKKES
jgi:ATP-dependent DNA helicase RecG